MFHRVSTAATEVATTTILTGWYADTFRSSQQVYTFQRQTGFTFAVDARVVVANQAVNIGLFFKIKVCIIPSVTCMTSRAGCPVTLDTDTEIVDGFLFAGGVQSFTALDRHRFGFPAPVRRMQHLFTGIFVTGETGCGHLLAGCEFTKAIKQILVIYVGRALRHIFPGCIKI